MTDVLRTSRLRVSLGGARILDRIDLTVTDGEVVGLLGANGSGKSTLVRALVGLVPVESGTVEVFGRRPGRSVAWERVGYVPQRPTVTTGVPATAGEMVVAGLLHGRRLVPPRGARERAQEALALVGLDETVHRPVRELSGGQQQRVLIARALVRRPDLLLLDEPVAGVDLPSQQAFATALARLADQGTTIVVVLHELGALAPLIQRAVVLRHGRVVHDGAPPRPAPDHAAPDHDHVHPHGDEVDDGGLGLAPTVRW
jgi:zinc transport system ATP-binding protein